MLRSDFRNWDFRKLYFRSWISGIRISGQFFAISIPWTQRESKDFDTVLLPLTTCLPVILKTALGYRTSSFRSFKWEPKTALYDRLVRSLSQKEKAMVPMEPELWLMVAENLSTLSARSASSVFGFDLTIQQAKHSEVWSLIIQNEVWTSIASYHGLNPVLIGQNLNKLYNTKPSESPKPSYIVLMTGDRSGDIRFHRDVFLESLQPHTFNPSTCEVVFKNSHITLNVADAIYNPDTIYMNPKRLFSCRNKCLQSAYLYWQDSHHALRKIKSTDVVSIGGSAPAIQDVYKICALTISSLDNSKILRQQFVFQHPRCRDTRLRVVARNKEDHISGWEWQNDEIVWFKMRRH